jgi:hypothetical protein
MMNIKPMPLPAPVPNREPRKVFAHAPFTSMNGPKTRSARGPAINYEIGITDRAIMPRMLKTRPCTSGATFD